MEGGDMWWEEIVQWEKYKYRYVPQSDSFQGLGSLEKEGRKQGVCSDPVVLNLESKRTHVPPVCFCLLSFASLWRLHQAATVRVEVVGAMGEAGCLVRSSYFDNSRPRAFLETCPSQGCRGTCRNLSTGAHSRNIAGHSQSVCSC